MRIEISNLKFISDETECLYGFEINKRGKTKFLFSTTNSMKLNRIELNFRALLYRLYGNRIYIKIFITNFLLTLKRIREDRLKRIFDTESFGIIVYWMLAHCFSETAVSYNFIFIAFDITVS